MDALATHPLANHEPYFVLDCPNEPFLLGKSKRLGSRCLLPFAILMLVIVVVLGKDLLLERLTSLRLEWHSIQRGDHSGAAGRG